MSLPDKTGKSSEALLLETALSLVTAALTGVETAELRRLFELRCEAQIGQTRGHRCDPRHNQGACPIGRAGADACLCCLDLADVVMGAAATYSVFPEAVTAYLFSAYEIGVVVDHLPEGFVLEPSQPDHPGERWQIVHPARAQAERDAQIAAQATKEAQVKTLLALLIQIAFRDYQRDRAGFLVEVLAPLVQRGLPPDPDRLIRELEGNPETPA